MGNERHLVLGGAGFLGCNLARALLARDDTVICVDNLITGGIDRIEALLRDARFKFIRGDVAEVLQRGDIGRMDVVWQLAALASPVHYFKRPLDTASAGADAQRAALAFAADHAAKFFYSSTSELYASPDVVPTPETYVGRINPLSLRAPYDVSKAYGETVACIYARETGLDARIARLFNAYGPWCPLVDGRVIPAYLGAAMKGQGLPVHGDGLQTRSFCYVDDTIAGMLSIMDAPKRTFAGLPNPPVLNLGNPKEVTMRALAEMCWAAVRQDPLRIQALPENPDDPRRRCPDISRIRGLLGWEPQIPLAEGLKRTADWFQEKS